ncbi:MAG: hypothetical protein KKD92_10275 [Proteobacteria bacterium]|nr:hypothetical protein [Pseudomonadota bacterium]
MPVASTIRSLASPARSSEPKTGVCLTAHSDILSSALSIWITAAHIAGAHVSGLSATFTADCFILSHPGNRVASRPHLLPFERLPQEATRGRINSIEAQKRSFTRQVKRRFICAFFMHSI